MTRRPPRDLAASVRQRLLDLARQREIDFQAILSRYGSERLLYRLSRSPHHDRFVLKGAMLFSMWASVPHRPTRDIDLLGAGDESPANLAKVFRELCALSVEEDGLVFPTDSVSAAEMQEEGIYGGVRIRLLARLGAARIPLQVDIGFGDAVTLPTPETEFPALLDFPAPRLRVYPRETVVAEKFQAMVALGMSYNTTCQNRKACGLGRPRKR